MSLQWEHWVSGRRIILLNPLPANTLKTSYTLQLAPEAFCSIQRQHPKSLSSFWLVDRARSWRQELLWTFDLQLSSLFTHSVIAIAVLWSYKCLLKLSLVLQKQVDMRQKIIWSAAANLLTFKLWELFSKARVNSMAHIIQKHHKEVLCVCIAKQQLQFVSERDLSAVSMSRKYNAVTARSHFVPQPPKAYKFSHTSKALFTSV